MCWKTNWFLFLFLFVMAMKMANHAIITLHELFRKNGKKRLASFFFSSFLSYLSSAWNYWITIVAGFDVDYVPLYFPNLNIEIGKT